MRKMYLVFSFTAINSGPLELTIYVKFDMEIEHEYIYRFCVNCYFNSCKNNDGVNV
jgi:hypothetical protein